MNLVHQILPGTGLTRHEIRRQHRRRDVRVAVLLLGTSVLFSLTAIRAQDNQDSKPQAVRPFVAILDSTAAWQHLPECRESGAPLPGWARALAPTLPYTTAAVLELDAVYRSGSEIDRKLRAKIRWTAAHANRCEYGMAYALADLRAAGAAESEISALQGRTGGVSESESRVLEFAGRLTTAAYSVTDAEVEVLRGEFGEAGLVAIVLHLAYANFMDRLVLSLGVPVEEDGPLPPRVFHFPAFASLDKIPVAVRPSTVDLDNPPEPPRPAPKLSEVFGHDWSAISFDELQRRIEGQRNRKGRVSVPLWEDVKGRLPPGMYSADRPMKVQWSLVVLGHQTDLGVAWLRCLRVFAREAEFNQVLAESMFWVVTRSLDCFY